jgi:prevent-host-death family protein
MKKATAADVKARFAMFLNESRKGPVIVTRDGNPIAVLMGVHDEDELDRLIFASSRRLHEILEAGRQEVREGRGIPSEEFWKQVETERPATQTRKRNREKKNASPA